MASIINTQSHSATPHTPQDIAAKVLGRADIRHTQSLRLEKWLYSVILHGAQRSEESKVAAHPPVSDFRYLTSAGAAWDPRSHGTTPAAAPTLSAQSPPNRIRTQNICRTLQKAQHYRTP